MTASNRRFAVRAIQAWLLMLAIYAAPMSALAQTRISYRSNKYKVTDDVQAGRQAAAEIERQLPLLRDGYIDNYIDRIGRRLADAIPPDFQHPEFRYSFTVVNTRDVNAFALPGGPMYVNRGLIEVARNEGELAGVMAHELSHVALRHGTAQATKAEKLQYGAIAGAILGSVIGGGLGQVIGQGTQLGLGTYFLKFSREYETEADILGAQIMARAGYDPRDLANMFQTLQQQSGRGGNPEFLSSHPNPANRLARINQEAALLRTSGDRVSDNRQFAQVQSRLRSQGRAPSMEEVARSGQRYPPGRGGADYPEGRLGRVEYPSGRFRTYTEGNNMLRVSVPENWQRLPSQNSIWYVPQGGYGQGPQGGAVFTHGAEIGFSAARSNDLRRETEQYLQDLAQSNQNLRQQSRLQNASVAGRSGLAITFSNINEATGQREIVTVVTALMRNGGGLFHMIAVAPESDYRQFQPAFNNILRSVQLND